MSRRPDPTRIRIAREDALRNRLIGEGLLPAQADRWIAALLRDGGDPSTAAFWERGYDWINDQLAGGRRL